MEVMDLVAGPRAAELHGPSTSFFLVRKDDGTVVGEAGYFLDEASGTAKVGYSVVEPSWGRGYATEALRALVAHLRDRPGVVRIAAETFVDHAASRRVMEKAGLRQVGSRVGEEDGQTVDLVLYELVP
jgi:RimJ/RimL family protein N-acetyltransferase